MTEKQMYHYGFDPASDEFILWKRGRATEVCRIPFADALAMAATVAHVAANHRAASAVSQ